MLVPMYVRGRYKHWIGLLEWNTGLDYWNEIFSFFPLYVYPYMINDNVLHSENLLFVFIIQISQYVIH